MTKENCIISLVITLLMIQRIEVHAAPKSFNVVTYGAKGDGVTDNSQAFMNAWRDVCGTSNEAELIVPRGGTFLLKPVTFQGPCKATRIIVQILGNIVAPNSIDAFRGYSRANWLQFKSVYGLIIDGQSTGRIDGNGAMWWKTCVQGKPCQQRPTTVTFNRCNNLKLYYMKFVNSPGNFISLAKCNVVEVSHLHITAPKDSPNTDGIDLIGATNVNIHDTTIGVGDDCIAMNNHAHNVNITRVNCGPGHGISIGSLGYDGVQQVHVSDCKFFGSFGGVKIKTWQEGNGLARGITYENIEMNNVQYPILIDQYYCPNHNCGLNKTTSPSIKISDVSYKNIYGTSATEAAIVFNCSKVIGCNNIRIDEINLKSTLHGKPAKAETINAHGNVGKSVVPNLKLN